jgi:chromosome segregation ATPase
MDGNHTINPLTGKQWDTNSLIERLLELQDALLQSQEKNITLSAQIRELERQVRDAEDLRTAHDNQAQLLADKSRENKYIHQELSRLSSMLAARLQEGEELRAGIVELQHQLKTSQSDRDLLAIMLTEAENAARQTTSGKLDATSSKKDTTNWTKYLKGK